MLHRLDLELSLRQCQVELSGDTQSGTDFVEQDVGAARAAGDAERDASRLRQLGAQRLFDHGARFRLCLRGSREPRLVRRPVEPVDHVAREQHHARQRRMRGRVSCRPPRAPCR